MNTIAKPTARVSQRQDGRLELIFDSRADFNLAIASNKHSHMLPIDQEAESLDGGSIVFAESVDLETLVRHFSLQLRLEGA